MRLIILTQYYLPETGAPQNRLSDLARRFQEMGHTVTVLTAKPNYPVGRFFPGFRSGLWRRGLTAGIDTIRCWLYPTTSKKVSLRLLNYFSFVLSSATVGDRMLPEADFLLVESPPLFLGLAAVWLARRKGARLVFNVSDLYPETAISLGYLEQPTLRTLMYRLEAWCYRHAILVSGQTEGIVNSVRTRFPDKETFLLTNGVDVEKFSADSAPVDCTGSPTAQNAFVIGYAGIHGHAQRLDVALRAAALLPPDCRIRIEFLGDGPLRKDLQALAAELGLRNVQFRGHASHAEVLSAMKKWDAGLVPLMDALVMAGALPSKMFEVMASALPVILCAPVGEASALVQRAQAGFWVPAEQPEELAELLQSLELSREECRTLGNNGREYVLQHFNRAEIAAKFANRLEEIMTNPGNNLESISIVGARPQFIKAAMVSAALLRRGVEDILVHTGQHYDFAMSALFFKQLGLAEPTYNLGIGSANHGAQTGRILEGIETILVDEKPDAVVVYGDTNSTLAGALAAAKLHVPVAHVEAGLRSYNRRMPEEINRVLTDHVSDLLLVPTAGAVDNLRAEGIAGESVHVVGDVMYDAVLAFEPLYSPLRAELLRKLDLEQGNYFIATVHRADSTDNPQVLSELVEALGEVAAGIAPVVWPVHPRSRACMSAAGIVPSPKLVLIEPVGYLEMQAYLSGARGAITDSGGLQKEAAFHRVPAVTLRDETEWTETVQAGCNVLVGTDKAKILAEAARSHRPAPACDAYGSGDAAGKIAELLTARYGGLQ